MSRNTHRSFAFGTAFGLIVAALIVLFANPAEIHPVAAPLLLLVLGAAAFVFTVVALPPSRSY